MTDTPASDAVDEAADASTIGQAMKAAFDGQVAITRFFVATSAMNRADREAIQGDLDQLDRAYGDACDALDAALDADRPTSTGSIPEAAYLTPADRKWLDAAQAASPDPDASAAARAALDARFPPATVKDPAASEPASTGSPTPGTAGPDRSGVDPSAPITAGEGGPGDAGTDKAPASDPPDYSTNPAGTSGGTTSGQGAQPDTGVPNAAAAPPGDQGV